ncbi:MAG: amino acid ABC transporter permease, partial [Actinobacteria bacterium]
MDAISTWWSSNPITNQFLNFEVIAEAIPIVLAALPVSLLFGVVSFVLAIPGGLLLAFMKMSPMRFIRWIATAYVDVVRGTPLFLQVLIFFFAVPLIPAYRVLVQSNPWMKEVTFLNMDVTIYMRGIIVLTLNSAAYMAEIFRAGIQSIPKGQLEAARSLGMTVPQAMSFVIIPQTVRRILPTMM